jgi:uncharacterized protein YxjI
MPNFKYGSGRKSDRKTSTVYKTSNPIWNNEFSLEYSHPDDFIVFEIFDANTVGHDDSLGCATVQINSLSSGTSETWLKLKNSKSGRLHVKFHPHLVPAQGSSAGRTPIMFIPGSTLAYIPPAGQNQWGVLPEGFQTEVMTPSEPLNVFGGGFYTYNIHRALKIRQRLFSFKGDDATVKDLSGNIVFSVLSKDISIRPTANMSDSDGDHVCRISHKFASAHTKMKIWDPEDHCVAIVQKKKVLQLHDASASIFIFTNGKQKGYRKLKPQIRVKGDVYGHAYKFIMGGVPIVRVGTHLWADSHLAAGKDEYAYEIAPFVDSAFITACIMALDEIFSDDIEHLQPQGLIPEATSGSAPLKSS